MKQIICKDCGKSFSISLDEEKFYTSKGLQIPKRCKECRKNRKEEKKQEESRIKAEQDEKELLSSISHTLFVTSFARFKRKEK